MNQCYYYYNNYCETVRRSTTNNFQVASYNIEVALRESLCHMALFKTT